MDISTSQHEGRRSPLLLEGRRKLPQCVKNLDVVSQAKEKRAAERRAKKEAEKAAAATKKEEAENGDKGPESAPSDTNHDAEKTSVSAAADADAAPAASAGTVTDALTAKVNANALIVIL